MDGGPSLEENPSFNWRTNDLYAIFVCKHLLNMTLRRTSDLPQRAYIGQKRETQRDKLFLLLHVKISPASGTQGLGFIFSSALFYQYLYLLYDIGSGHIVI